jgi:hypothetical protein
VKQFEGETEAKGVIETALSAMTSLAQHINEMKRRHEHAVRVQEIQSLLHDWQVSTNCDLCSQDSIILYECGKNKVFIIKERNSSVQNNKT